jgi:hypothetical protein
MPPASTHTRWGLAVRALDGVEDVVQRGSRRWGCRRRPREPVRAGDEGQDDLLAGGPVIAEYPAPHLGIARGLAFDAGTGESVARRREARLPAILSPAQA